MSPLENIFSAEVEDKSERDAVLVRFGAFGGLDRIHKLDIRLFEEIPLTIGSYDGHEVAFDDSHGTLFTYGENAEELFKTMQPILKEFDFLDEASIYLQFCKGKKEPLELVFDFEIT